MQNKKKQVLSIVTRDSCAIYHLGASAEGFTSKNFLVIKLFMLDDGVKNKKDPST